MAVISVASRLLLSVVQVRIALHINKSREASKGGNSKQGARVPITTVLEVLHGILLGVALTLMGLNIVNADNGWGPAMVQISVMPQQIAYMLSCIKLVHLGRRVIPRHIRKNLEASEPNVNNGSSSGKELEAISSDILLAQALFNIAGNTIVVRQTFRVTHYVEEIHIQRLMSVLDQQSGNKESLIALQRTTRKMKERTIGFTLSIAASVILFVIAGVGYFFSWQIIIGILWSALFAALASTVMYWPRSMTLCSLISTKNTKAAASIAANEGDEFSTSSNKKQTKNTTLTQARAGDVTVVVTSIPEVSEA